LPKILSWR